MRIVTKCHLIIVLAIAIAPASAGRSVEDYCNDDEGICCPVEDKETIIGANRCDWQACLSGASKPDCSFPPQDWNLDRP